MNLINCLLISRGRYLAIYKFCLVSLAIHLGHLIYVNLLWIRLLILLVRMNNLRLLYNLLNIRLTVFLLLLIIIIQNGVLHNMNVLLQVIINLT